MDNDVVNVVQWLCVVGEDDGGVRFSNGSVGLDFLGWEKGTKNSLRAWKLWVEILIKDGSVVTM